MPGDRNVQTDGTVRTSYLDWSSLVVVGLAGPYEMYFAYQPYSARTGPRTRERETA